VKFILYYEQGEFYMMTTEEWIKRKPLMEQESNDAVREYLFQISSHAFALKEIFADIVDKIHPLDNIAIGDHSPKIVAESELTNASSKIKEHLVAFYRLVWSLKNTLIERAKEGTLVCDHRFVKQFNMTVHSVINMLSENNERVEFLNTENTSEPPKWFNTPQHKEGTEHTQYLTLQILYYECYKVADVFFTDVNKLRSMEPKIEIPQKPTNYITNPATITSLESQYPLSKEIKAAKAEATTELRKTHPDAFIA